MNPSIEKMKSEFVSYLSTIQNEKPTFTGTISSMADKFGWLESALKKINSKGKEYLETLEGEEHSHLFDAIKKETESFLSKNK